jgi:hypothetical protein
MHAWCGDVMGSLTSLAYAVEGDEGRKVRPMLTGARIRMEHLCTGALQRYCADIISRRVCQGSLHTRQHTLEFGNKPFQRRFYG